MGLQWGVWDAWLGRGFGVTTWGLRRGVEIRGERAGFGSGLTGVQGWGSGFREMGCGSIGVWRARGWADYGFGEGCGVLRG